jgi:hypothetical protein
MTFSKRKERCVVLGCKRRRRKEGFIYLHHNAGSSISDKHTSFSKNDEKLFGNTQDLEPGLNGCRFDDF